MAFYRFDENTVRFCEVSREEFEAATRCMCSAVSPGCWSAMATASRSGSRPTANSSSRGRSSHRPTSLAGSGTGTCGGSSGPRWTRGSRRICRRYFGVSMPEVETKKPRDAGLLHAGAMHPFGRLAAKSVAARNDLGDRGMLLCFCEGRYQGFARRCVRFFLRGVAREREH